VNKTRRHSKCPYENKKKLTHSSCPTAPKERGSHVEAVRQAARGVRGGPAGFGGELAHAHQEPL
jgi:hypothetical protein